MRIPMLVYVGQNFQNHRERSSGDRLVTEFNRSDTDFHIRISNWIQPEAKG